MSAAWSDATEEFAPEKAVPKKRSRPFEEAFAELPSTLQWNYDREYFAAMNHAGTDSGMWFDPVDLKKRVRFSGKRVTLALELYDHPHAMGLFMAEPDADHVRKVERECTVGTPLADGIKSSKKARLLHIRNH